MADLGYYEKTTLNYKSDYYDKLFTGALPKEQYQWVRWGWGKFASIRTGSHNADKSICIHDTLFKHILCTKLSHSHKRNSDRSIVTFLVVTHNHWRCMEKCFSPSWITKVKSIKSIIIKCYRRTHKGLQIIVRNRKRELSFPKLALTLRAIVTQGQTIPNLNVSNTCSVYLISLWQE